MVIDRRTTTPFTFSSSISHLHPTNGAHQVNPRGVSECSGQERKTRARYPGFARFTSTAAGRALHFCVTPPKHDLTFRSLSPQLLPLTPHTAPLKRPPHRLAATSPHIPTDNSAIAERPSRCGSSLRSSPFSRWLGEQPERLFMPFFYRATISAPPMPTYSTVATDSGVNFANATN